MKIAMLIDSWDPIIGGGPVHVMKLAEKLVKHHSCEVDIFTRAIKQDRKKYSKTEHFLNGKLKIIRLGFCTKFWNPVGRLSYLITPLFIKTKKYDLIHAHAFAAGIPAYILQKIRKIPVVFTVHGSGLDCHEKLASGIKKYLIFRIEQLILLKLKYTHIISVNKEFLDMTKGIHKRITYIPNGVDIEKFNAIKEKNNDILFVGRLSPQKSVTILLKAMKKVQAQRPKTKIRIIGYGRQKNTLKKLSEKLKIKNITFDYKEGEKLLEEYLSSKVFVLPSVYEGFPLTILEAWAAGMPVITTNVSGNRELVQHKKNGLLVQPENPENLAKAILYALDNPEEMRRWAINGKATAKQLSWNKTAEKTYEVYKKTLHHENAYKINHEVHESEKLPASVNFL